MTATFSTLLELDARLARSGMHPLSPWWIEHLGRFYAHPTARSLVARVGRGGIKTGTARKVALNEILHGDWPVPPGEVHYWAHVSENKAEASQCLVFCETALSVLGVPYERRGDEIVLPTLRRGIRVFACQIGAVSGFRCFGYSADEVCKWENADHSANPAREVCASLDAMTVTHPGARTLMFSSPWGKDDLHATRIEQGETAGQLVVYAPSWLANPTITRDHCLHLAKGDHKVFLREYQAEPQDATSGAFDYDAADRCFRPPPDTFIDCAAIGVIDWSGGRGDTCAWGTVRWMRSEVTRYLAKRIVLPPLPGERVGREIQDPVLDGRGQRVPNLKWSASEARALLHVSHVDGIEGKFWRHTSSDLVVARMVVEVFRPLNISVVVGDQRSEEFLRVEFGRYGMRFHPLPWTNPSKEAAVATIRRWMRDQTLVCAPHEGLRRQFHGFAEQLTPSGFVTYGARKGGHDDYAALVMTAAMADREHLIPSGAEGSPLRDHMRRMIRYMPTMG
jgi:hypothetical protein